jgi:hypothetical protein
MLKDRVILTHKQWVDAAEFEGFDAYKDSSDDLDESWGLLMIGFADENEESFEFFVMDKRKWFIAKIKHGF